MRNLLSGAVVVVAAAALSACGGGAEAATTTKTVEVRAFNFSPDPLTVKKGTKVRFVNYDRAKHTATAGTRKSPKPGVFNVKLAASQGASAPSTASFTFRKKGTFAYFCKFHPGSGMTAKVIVR